MENINIGLSTAEAISRAKKYGSNEIEQPKQFIGIKIFFSQFKSILIIILILAGGLSLFMGKTVDAIVIFTIVIINSIIGFIQEYKAENAVGSLKKMLIPYVNTYRNNKITQIPTINLVPDDIILINEGDIVPADLEILEGFSITADESILTGESAEVHKKKSQGKEGILYKGTTILSGHGKAKVKSTGKNTEFGKIVEKVIQQSDTISPLTKQLDLLGKKTFVVILFLITLTFLLGLIKDVPIKSMILTTVALGVSAIPEGLPIIVTLTLAIGIQSLSRQKAIIRKMNAIETLGATTIICTDKTGTLTENKMTVEDIFTLSGNKSTESIYLRNGRLKPEEKKLLEIAENCNNSKLGTKNIGDPMEIALRLFSKKSGNVENFKRLDEKPFSSERKYMGTLNQVGKNKEAFIKGALETVLKKCSFTLKNGKRIILNKTLRNEIIETANKYSSSAFRVLGFAYKPKLKKYEDDSMIFVGLAALTDPPRKSVKKSLQIAGEAGIKIKIITGDNPHTTIAIAKQIGIKRTTIITGEKIDLLSDEELLKEIYKTDIFARTSPDHKYRIVDLLRKNNEVVAVTGDGINDAPALKHADIGIAMGKSGTETTKEVSDITLKDDNFSAIIDTIKEGRKIYNNILAFVKYLLSANYDSILTVAILTIFGFPLPILALQILWINLATDSLPALALGNSPATGNLMKEKPHPKEENIFNKFFIFILTAVIIQTAANIFLFIYGIEIDKSFGINTSDINIASYARTLVFTEIVMFELFFVFTCKEEKISFKSIKSNKKLILAVFISLIAQLLIIYFPPMQEAFKTMPLRITDWLIILTLSASSLLVPKITKIIKKS